MSQFNGPAMSFAGCKPLCPTTCSLEASWRLVGILDDEKRPVLTMGENRLSSWLLLSADDEQLQLKEGKNRIGSSPDNDIILPGADENHCFVCADGVSLVLFPIGMCYINGEETEQPVRLQHGFSLGFGRDITMRIRLTEPSKHKPVRSPPEKFRDNLESEDFLSKVSRFEFLAHSGSSPASSPKGFWFVRDGIRSPTIREEREPDAADEANTKPNGVDEKTEEDDEEIVCLREKRIPDDVEAIRVSQLCNEDLTASQRDLRDALCALMEDRKRDEEEALQEKRRLEEMLNLLERADDLEGEYVEISDLKTKSPPPKTRIITNGTLLSSPMLHHREMPTSPTEQSPKKEKSRQRRGDIESALGFVNAGFREFDEVEASSTATEVDEDDEAEEGEEGEGEEAEEEAPEEEAAEEGATDGEEEDEDEEEGEEEGTKLEEEVSAGAEKKEAVDEADQQQKQLWAERDQCVARLSSMKQKIIELESQQNEALRELELERALLEGEQQSHIDQLNQDQESITSLQVRLQQLTEQATKDKRELQAKLEAEQTQLEEVEATLERIDEDQAEATEEASEVVRRQQADLILSRDSLYRETEDLEFRLTELEASYETELDRVTAQLYEKQRSLLGKCKDRETSLHEIDAQHREMLSMAREEIERLEVQRCQVSEALQKEKSRFAGLEKQLMVNGDRVDTPRDKPTASEDSGEGGSASDSDHENNECRAETIRRLERQLATAQAEKIALLQQQVEQREREMEELQAEKQRRMELEQRLAEETQNRQALVERAVQLRERSRNQSRPLTRYLPIRGENSDQFDLRVHIETAGHQPDAVPELHLDKHSCRGTLLKCSSRGLLGHTWKRRWFVFDRTKRCLLYYSDRKSSRPRGGLYFQSISEVYVDHLRIVKSPSPELTLVVKSSERTLYLVAPNAEAMRIWVDVIFTGAEAYEQYQE